MTDLEITRLCAKALLPNVWAHGEWNPLHNDAQAMALVKKFLLHVEWYATKEWAASLSVGGDKYLIAASPDLNRAICECVAKMQAAK